MAVHMISTKVIFNSGLKYTLSGMNPLFIKQNQVFVVSVLRRLNHYSSFSMPDDSQLLNSH